MFSRWLSQVREITSSLRQVSLYGKVAFRLASSGFVFWNRSEVYLGPDSFCTWR